MRRSGKFYRRNEREIMEQLGLKPTINSGSGWIEKEDGQSEDLICQLKSTDANSIKVDKKDLDTLNHNAVVSHKLPVFAIQFLKSNEIYLSPDNLKDIAKYLKTGTIETGLIDLDLTEAKELKKKNKTIKSSIESREEYNKEVENKFKKGKRSAL